MDRYKTVLNDMDSVLKSELYDDMIAYPYHYSYGTLELLMAQDTSDDVDRFEMYNMFQRSGELGPKERFFCSGIKLTYDELYNAGVLPRNVDILKRKSRRDAIDELLLNPDESITSLPVADLDTYIIGVPCSGVTTMFASLIKRLLDLNFTVVDGLEKAVWAKLLVMNGFFPNGTWINVRRSITLDLKSMGRLNVVEASQMTDYDLLAPFVSLFNLSKNRKLILFNVDTTRPDANNYQEEYLHSVLDVLKCRNDIIGIAIILNKSDRINKSDLVTCIGNANLSCWLRSLTNYCKSRNIQPPCIKDFSIGKLFVGDLFSFQEYDTDTLIEYILRYSNCRKFNKFL